jgi:antitoxin HigA-1
MITTVRRPSIGEILVEEFLEPLGLTQEKLAEASGLTRKHINELCRDKRTITASTALILARVFGTTPDFWLNLQRHVDLWEAENSPKESARIARARPYQVATGASA